MSRCDAGESLFGDELLKAVIDPRDLKAQQKMHLENCRICRSAVENTGARIERLGATARRLAPAPARVFRLPQTGPHPKPRRAPWMLAFAALALLLVVLAPRIYRLDSGNRVPAPESGEVRTAASDRNLMQEINALVENALPVHYQSLVSAVSAGYEDSDPLDFIVPDIGEPDPLT